MKVYSPFNRCDASRSVHLISLDDSASSAPAQEFESYRKNRLLDGSRPSDHRMVRCQSRGKHFSCRRSRLRLAAIHFANRQARWQRIFWGPLARSYGRAFRSHDRWPYCLVGVMHGAQGHKSVACFSNPDDWCNRRPPAAIRGVSRQRGFHLASHRRDNRWDLHGFVGQTKSFELNATSVCTS